MCGRYSFTKVDEFGRRYGLAKVPSSVGENFNVAPTQTMPVIKNVDGKNTVELMRWGIPRFIGPGKVKDVFNTRADKAFHNWKKLTMTQRILIPATGFYEWKAQSGGKQPFLIKPKDEELFSFAGIWNTWKDDDGKMVDTYSIITTEPNEEMSKIHNRMPVILHEKDEAAWIDPANNNNQEFLEELLVPYDDKGLLVKQYDGDLRVGASKKSGLDYPINSK